jgi:hypothetical protein
MFTPLALNCKRSLQGLRLYREPRRARRPLLIAASPTESAPIPSFSYLCALRVFAFSSLSSPFDFKLSTTSPERGGRVNLRYRTPLFAIPASSLQLIENTATLSPISATLTSRVKPKSCVCHSYKKHPGWGTPCKGKSSLCCRTPQLSTASFLLLPCPPHPGAAHA